ncbi:MAG TPA: L,D-transpeptidase [Candidatus Udaeobacter sp.]|nr:L,D-transpeptidase [Candidatus Udaeobacter sp.]
MSTYHWVGFLVLGVLFASLPPQVEARKHSTKKTAHKEQQSPAQIEAAARLQIFLDRSNFSPGRIDGRYNEFTWKALALYRESRSEQPQLPPPGAKSNAAPDINGLDLSSVDPVFTTYSVTQADLQNVGKLPSSPKEQAKLKALLYRNPADAIAEKFHCDVHFLELLNPGKTKSIKPGDQLRVPNVQPFELGQVKDIKPGSEINAPAANELPDEQDKTPAEQPQASQDPSASPESSASTSVKIDTKTNMLGIFQGDKLIAAYPVTVGSAQTASPIGDWKVKGVARWPRFRYDEKMLKHGERSGHFFMLPPGPRNPVGVLWIALNKKGIGIHGTASPDSIGRSVSHGCIRLANWDVVRLAERVKFGTPVSIH